MPHVENCRGFVFARLAEQGIGFRDYFGDSLTSIDNMSTARPRTSRGCGWHLRYLHDSS
jgi:hypothetical protein